jgi:hypothetical protein
MDAKKSLISLCFQKPDHPTRSDSQESVVNVSQLIMLDNRGLPRKSVVCLRDVEVGIGLVLAL